MSVHPSDRNWHQWSPEGSSNLSTCGYLGGIIGNLVLWPSHSHHADNGTLCELTFTLAAAAALLGIWRWISVGKKVKNVFCVCFTERPSRSQRPSRATRDRWSARSGRYWCESAFWFFFCTEFYSRINQLSEQWNQTAADVLRQKKRKLIILI